MEILANDDTSSIVILGHGLTITYEYEISPGIFLRPGVPKIDLAAAASSSRNFPDYLACVSAGDIATFALEVSGETGRQLAIKAWNSLWLFHLLSIACSTPCFSLCAIACGNPDQYSSANRNLILSAEFASVTASTDQLVWAKAQQDNFQSLTLVPTFAAAMRCFGNAHYLFDLDTRIMLLWAGIEGLLSVDGELNRRLALYAALLHKGSPTEKSAYFASVKKAYAVRSRVVHGGSPDHEKLKLGYKASSGILAELLSRCVELGRVPSVEEMDALAVSQTLA